MLPTAPVDVTDAPAPTLTSQGGTQWLAYFVPFA